MTTIGDIYKFIDGIAPFSLAEHWDNSGLIIGDMGDKADRIMLALDVSDSVIDEATKLGVNLIITHHPVIFSAMKNISSTGLVHKLIRSNIGVISAHTNLDIAGGGVNDCLSDILEIHDTKPLMITERKNRLIIMVMIPTNYEKHVCSAMFAAGAGMFENYSSCCFTVSGTGQFMPESGANPMVGTIGNTGYTSESQVTMVCTEDTIKNVVSAILKSHPYEKPAYHIFEDRSDTVSKGYGRIGTLKNEVEFSEFSETIKKKLSCDRIRYYDSGNMIKKVAVCGGSGGDMLYEAYKNDCDILITGDVKHNIFNEAAQYGITVVDAGHYNTEYPIIPRLAGMLASEFTKLKFIVATSESCPVNFK